MIPGYFLLVHELPNKLSGEHVAVRGAVFCSPRAKFGDLSVRTLGPSGKFSGQGEKTGHKKEKNKTTSSTTSNYSRVVALVPSHTEAARAGPTTAGCATTRRTEYKRSVASMLFVLMNFSKVLVQKILVLDAKPPSLQIAIVKNAKPSM